jgi:hypothetical protein
MIPQRHDYGEYAYRFQPNIRFGLGLWCLMPISTIFRLYRGATFIGGGNLTMGIFAFSYTCKLGTGKGFQGPIP